ncbi:MAG: archaemetzincin, partial [Candidatus Riflebacteria bacterium]
MNLLRPKLLLFLLVLALVAGFFLFSTKPTDSIRPFIPLTHEDRISALGNFDGRSANEAAAYSFKSFIPKNPPGKSDWLSRYPEKGQTYNQFVKGGFKTPSSDCKTICILPVYFADEQPLPFLPVIASYCEIFFGLKTIVLSPTRLDSGSVSRRLKEYGLQFNASQILERIKSQKPKDCFALVAVTPDDIFPDRTQSHSSGLASPNDSSAIVSYARLRSASDSSDQIDTLLKARALSVTTHEICHILGLRHCIYFQCLQNGAMGVAELDRTPLLLCPICLRKIVYSLG